VAEGGEILICGRRDSPYRLPGYRDASFDPLAQGAPDSVMRERAKWVEHGDSGIGSCSAVGPGGFTGCLQKGWKQERDQTQWESTIRRR
jgi:hypothetical protein